MGFSSETTITVGAPELDNRSHFNGKPTPMPFWPAYWGPGRVKILPYLWRNFMQWRPNQLSNKVVIPSLGNLNSVAQPMTGPLFRGWQIRRGVINISLFRLPKLKTIISFPFNLFHSIDRHACDPASLTAIWQQREKPIGARSHQSQNHTYLRAAHSP
jgi:hypothetical protein